MPPAPSAEADTAVGVEVAEAVLASKPSASILDLLRHERALALTDDQLLAAASHMLKANADISEFCKTGSPTESDEAEGIKMHEVAILAERVCTRTLAHLLKQKPVCAARLKDLDTLRAGVRSNKEYTLLFLVARGSDFRPHLEQLTQEAIAMGASKALPWLLQWQENTEERLLDHLEGALAHISPLVPGPAQGEGAGGGAQWEALPPGDLLGLAECVEVLVGHGLETEGATITCRVSALSPGVREVLAAAAAAAGPEEGEEAGDDTVEVPMLEWAVLHAAATSPAPPPQEVKEGGSCGGAAEEGGVAPAPGSSGVKALIEAVLGGGAAVDGRGGAAVLLAARLLRPDLVRVLGQVGADLQGPRMPPGSTPLMEWAADAGLCPPQSRVLAALQAAAAAQADARAAAAAAADAGAAQASAGASGAGAPPGGGPSGPAPTPSPAAALAAKRPAAMVVEARGAAGGGVGAGGVLRTSPATIGTTQQRWPSPAASRPGGSSAAAAAAAARPAAARAAPTASSSAAATGAPAPSPSSNVVHQPAARPSEIAAAQRAQRAAAAAAANPAAAAAAAGTTPAPAPAAPPAPPPAPAPLAQAPEGTKLEAPAAPAPSPDTSAPEATGSQVDEAPAANGAATAAAEAKPPEAGDEAGTSPADASGAAAPSGPAPSQGTAEKEGAPGEGAEAAQGQPGDAGASGSGGEEEVSGTAGAPADGPPDPEGGEGGSHGQGRGVEGAGGVGGGSSGGGAGGKKKSKKKRGGPRDRGPPVVVIGAPPKDRGSLLPSTLLEELQRDSRFIEAVYRNDVAEARALLEAGADVHHKGDKALLLAMGAIDPDEPDKWMPRPRDRAPVLSMSRPMVDLLLAHGADVNARSGRAMCQAARWRDTYSLQYILSLPGVDPSWLTADSAVADWVASLGLPQLAGAGAGPAKGTTPAQ